MRVLVTGASGYVGWAVVHELRERGHQVVALVHESAARFPEDVEIRTGSLQSEGSLRSAVEGVDGVVHLAARSTVRDSVAYPTRTWRTNVAGTIDLLDALGVAAERSGAPGRLVFLSTGSVYGTPERQPISESAPLSPLNPYGASKVAAEQVIGWQVATGALGAVTLRLFSAAGAYAGRGDQDLSRIIPKATAVAAGTEPNVSINGDGSAIRDFVHVADIADAVALALDATEAGEHRAFNVGAVPASVADIIAATERVTGRAVAVEHRPAFAGEARELRADTTKIRAELGWTPKRATLDELVADQWAAMQR
ncbi:NAD-dependent epimerase/dehydratase family protein [Dactylosporangium sp. NPDC000555]|uniref:NAD-dependent epimerase/dehydratase family protein n=1 Tax=Dactylosporangium sp. NPDC000555 TaxID=3154260 RepID=UPI003316F49F